MTSHDFGNNQNPGTTSAYFTPGATPGGAAKSTGAEGAFPADGTRVRPAYFGVGAQPAVGNQSTHFAVGAYNNPAATGGAPQAAPMPTPPAPTNGRASTMTAVEEVPSSSGEQSTMTVMGGLPMTRVVRSTMTAVSAVTPADGGGHSTMTSVGAVLPGSGRSTMTAVGGAPMTGQSTITVVGGAPKPGGRSTMTAVGGAPPGGQSTMTTMGEPMTFQSTSRMNPFKWILAVLKRLFRRADGDREKDHEREAAGGDSNYCRRQVTDPNSIIEPMPFPLSLLEHGWTIDYSAQSYGFPEDHDHDGNASHNQKFKQGCIYVYVDGSVKRQHTGVGIFFGFTHPLTCYIDLTDPVNTRKWRHDSNLAETLGAMIALKRLFAWSNFDKNKKVILRTDSQTLIDNLKNVQAWLKNLAPGSAADPLMQCVTCVYKIADGFPGHVEFQKVKSHIGDRGNLVADFLARRALEKWEPQPTWTTDDFHLLEYKKFLDGRQPFTDVRKFLTEVNLKKLRFR